MGDERNSVAEKGEDEGGAGEEALFVEIGKLFKEEEQSNGGDYVGRD